MVGQTTGGNTISFQHYRGGTAFWYRHPSRRRKKRLLLEKLEETVLPVFSDRILDFDIEAAVAYAEVRATARAAGFTVAAADGYLAAIACYHHMTVATRDTTPFTAAGLKLSTRF